MPSGRDTAGVAGLLRSVQQQAGNRAAVQVARRIDRQDRPAGRRVGKAGLVDHDGFDGKGGAGLNLRSGPSTSSSVRKRISHNAHVHIDVDVGNNWRYVQVTNSPKSGDIGEFGYMSAGHLYDEDRMPDPEAKLHRITEGEQAQKLVARHYGKATTKSGEDERFYTNVLYHVNKQFGRDGVFKGPGVKHVAGRAVPITETYLRKGSQIWMPGLRFARSLKGKVSSGSWARDTWEKIKGYAKYVAAAGAFVAGLVVGAVKSLIDLVKTVVVGLYNTAKSLGKNIVRAGRQIYGLFTDKKKRKEFLYILGDLADKWWDPDNKLGLVERWWRRGQFIGYATAEVITGKLLASIAVKGAKFGAKAAKMVDWVANKSPRMASAMGKVAKAANSPKVLRARELVGATVTKVVDKGKTVYTVVKNNKVVRVVTAPVRGGLKAVDGAGNVIYGGVKLTAGMLEAGAKAAARKARLLRIARANRRLGKAIVKGNPAKTAKAARDVLRRTGDFDAVRKAVADGKMGKGDDAIKAAGDAISNARKAELDAVNAKVRAKILEKNPDMKVEFYDSGKPGLGSDRDVTITVTKDGTLTPVDARELAAESLRATRLAERALRRRGFRNPDRTLDTNYYTNLHEDAFTGATKVEKSAIIRDQTVTALAKMRMTMSNRQWRRFRKAQLTSVQPTDATRSIEKAVHKEMTTRLRDAERLAKKLRRDTLRRAKYDLRKALTGKDPVSDQEIRRLMTRVKVLEPDSYGVRETVKSVTQVQQPLQRIAEAKIVVKRLSAKKMAGEKLTPDEVAKFDEAYRTLRDARAQVAAAQSRRTGRPTTSAEMHALVQEAIENAAMLWSHTVWRRNTYKTAASAAKYHERVRHAYEAMRFKAATGEPTAQAFDLMAKKLAGDLDQAEALKTLRPWAEKLDPKMATAKPQAIFDLFVREARTHANDLSKQMHTRALGRDIDNPDAANPPTVPTTTKAKGPLQSEGDQLSSYADARRSKARKNPATAAARGKHGPHIRDNLYTGKAQKKVVEQLQKHGILKVAPGSTAVTVADSDRYMKWLERAYRHHGASHLDPRMRAAIEAYIGGGRPLPGVGVDAKTGRVSFAGSLPGTHAEILAINDAMRSGDINALGVAVVRAKSGDHFIACLHCGGILDEVAKRVPELAVWSGRAASKP